MCRSGGEKALSLVCGTNHTATHTPSQYAPVREPRIGTTQQERRGRTTSQGEIHEPVTEQTQK